MSETLEALVVVRLDAGIQAEFRAFTMMETIPPAQATEGRVGGPDLTFTP